jgi:hypothetical protein
VLTADRVPTAAVWDTIAGRKRGCFRRRLALDRTIPDIAVSGNGISAADALILNVVRSHRGEQRFLRHPITSQDDNGAGR